MTLPARRPVLSRRVALLAGLTLALVLAAAGLLAAAPRARAGTWTLISCTQPNGTPAPTDGWRPGVWAGGAAAAAGGVVNNCAAGGSLTALSSSAAEVASFTGPEWVFTAPAGETIAGGTITGALTAPQGQAWIATPNPAFDTADVVASCPTGGPCGTGGVLSGTFTIGHPGGDRLYAPAICSQVSAGACPAGTVPNAEVDIHAAAIELAFDATPHASNFGGPLLAGRAQGIADLRFTGTDLLRGGGSGPGVYGVVAQIDGRTVYQGVPDNDRGRCVSLGVDPVTGGQEFDHAQPCPAQARLTVPVNTSGLSDGRHRLTVTLGDAGGDTTTVLHRSITTFNPVQTPAPSSGGLAARLTIGYVFARRTTTLDAIRATGLPARGQITATCLGRRCPAIRPARVRIAAAGRLWTALKAAHFTAGQRLRLTIAARHGATERIQLRMRAGRRPGQRLL